MESKKKQQILMGVIGIVIIAISVTVGLKVLSPLTTTGSEEEPGVVAEEPQTQQEPPTEVQPKEKEFVPIVFIGKNSDGEEVYKVLKREYDKDIDGTKLRFAINSLIMGPKQNEKIS